MIATSHLYKRYQVFISSTFLDLKSERSEISRALTENNYIIEGMELFPAASKSQWKVIVDRIEKSDIYVLIIADRYGSIAGNAPQLEPGLVKDGEQISFTQLEFRYARKAGIPILAFIKTDRVKNPEVDAFVEEVQTSNLTTSYWNKKSKLTTAILAGVKDTIEDEDFAANKGWIRAESLMQPIPHGHPIVRMNSKLSYIKFITYANKTKQRKPQYKKFITRLNKNVDVWDEYIMLTINQSSHYIDGFQYYVRTDGDAVDFSSLFPFINKLSFSDMNAGAKDTIFNPLIEQPSNLYVNAASFYNGFQDGNTDLATKATAHCDVMRLLIDFTSIPQFDEKFRIVSCLLISKQQEETDISSEYSLIQPGVYFVEKKGLAEGSVLKFKFELSHE